MGGLGVLFRALLVLYPVRIERSARGAGAVALSVPAGLSPIANQPALRLLFHKKGFSYPDELAERADELAEWRDDRIETEECGVLGLFPQSNSDLLQDYDELLAPLDAGIPPGDLLGAATEVLPAEIRQAFAESSSSPARDAETSSARGGTASAPPIPVLYADPVQREVLAAARKGRALVVDGPSGTGKSQVIVNLVADALARGKRVAVVCEKRAALDVVAHRLSGVGLRHLLAVVHDVYEDRRTLYAQVAARLEGTAARTHDPAELAAAGVEAGAIEGSLAKRDTRSPARRRGAFRSDSCTPTPRAWPWRTRAAWTTSQISRSRGGATWRGRSPPFTLTQGSGVPVPPGEPPTGHRPGRASPTSTRHALARPCRIFSPPGRRPRPSRGRSRMPLSRQTPPPSGSPRRPGPPLAAVLWSRPMRAEGAGMDAFLALVSGPDGTGRRVTGSPRSVRSPRTPSGSFPRRGGEPGRSFARTSQPSGRTRSQPFSTPRRA